MTKEQFDMKYRGEKVAVHCDTEEKAKAFLSLAKSFGYRWIGNSDLEKTDNMWHMYKKDTTYAIFDEYTTYSNKSMAKKAGYKIINFELDEPFKETFNVGDVVYDKSGRKCVVKAIAYRVEYTSTHQGYREANEITHKKPLTKITKEQLAEMGYEVE